MGSEVEDIKKKLDIVEVINRYLPLKKRGRHYLACCPFHGEKTPSFIVSPELQIFKCFGCGKTGDIFTFVQEYERVDFKEALEDLAKMAGITIVHSRQMNDAESRRKRLVDLNSEAARFYHYILTTHPLGQQTLDYVLKRGITLDTIRLFKMGFSPPNSQLIVSYLLKKGFTQDELVATGTFGFSQYNQHQMYDRFQDRLIFPLADYRDRVLGFSGRILPTAKNPNLAKYINSPETDIYHKSQMLFGLNFAKESIKKENAVIIVEGEFDMISPFQAGVTNIVAIKGTAFTEDQLQLLKRYTDTLILGLDSDFAGNNAARKSIELADSMEFDIQVLSLGDKYKDPDEAVKGDLPFFKNQLKNTLPVWDFIISSAIKSHDSTTVKGKKEILALVLPFLVKINNNVIRTDYFHKLSDELDSQFDSIVEEAGRYQNTNFAPKNVAPTPVTTVDEVVTTRAEKLEEHLVTLILSGKNPVALSAKVNDKYTFNVHRFSSIILALKSYASEFDPQVFSQTLSPELVSTFQNLYLAATYLNLDSHQRLEEIQKTIKLIQIIELKNKLNLITQQLSQAENTGNNSLAEKLSLEYNQSLAELSRVQSSKR